MKGANQESAASGHLADTSSNIPEIDTMEVAEAVIVTVELDFGARIPDVAEALLQIERRYQPDEGIGRTFALLDAIGEPTVDRKLHLSMHVSSEKPGMGSLIFRNSGEILWHGRILPATHPPTSMYADKGLIILVDNGNGRSLTVDGSMNPVSLLDATLKEPGVPVRKLWQHGAEREITLIYSACGCPVKVIARRLGDKIIRTSDQPVIFPDDPAVVAIIDRLIGW